MVVPGHHARMVALVTIDHKILALFEEVGVVQAPDFFFVPVATQHHVMVARDEKLAPPRRA